MHLPGTEWNLIEKQESFVSRAKKLGIEHDMFFCTFRISPWKKMSKDVPTPGIEPGPAG